MVFPQQNYIIEEQKKEQTDSLYFVEFTNSQFVQEMFLYAIMNHQADQSNSKNKRGRSKA